MSCIKRWFESCIGSIPDEELLRYGYSRKEIDFMRESFEGRKDYDQNNEENN